MNDFVILAKTREGFRSWQLAFLDPVHEVPQSMIL